MLCRYFAVPYSLPKLDMIAIPDFSAGAMENYGLVTYRETALLYDDKHSAAANKQRVSSVLLYSQTQLESDNFLSSNNFIVFSNPTGELMCNLSYGKASCSGFRFLFFFFEFHVMVVDFLSSFSLFFIINNILFLIKKACYCILVVCMNLTAIVFSQFIEF